MANPEGGDQFRRSGEARARGTAPLIGYGPPAAGDSEERPVSMAELTQEIELAESVVNQLRPRIKALDRALKACDLPEDQHAALFRGVSPQERGFTLSLAKQLLAQPEVKRKAQIAVQQFNGAAEGLKAAQDLKAKMLVNQLTVVRDRSFNLAKFKGSAHPLYNFAMVFAAHPVLNTLFPPMRPPQTRPLPSLNHRGTQPLTAPPEAGGSGKAPSGAAGLFHQGAAEAAPSSLAERGLSLLKKAQAAAPGLLSRVTDRLRGRDDSSPQA